MYEVDPEFAPDQLVKGRLYRFKARNFFHGVWNGEYGFIGIREKFYDHFLFTEWHADPPFGGTVFAIENWEPIEDVPDDIEIREYFDTRCRQCEQAVEFRPDTPGTRAPGRWYHQEAALDADHDPHGLAYSPANLPLLGWLAMFEEDEYLRNYLFRLVAATPEEAQELRDGFVEYRQTQVEARKAQWEEEAASKRMAPQTKHEWDLEQIGNWRRAETAKIQDLPKEEWKEATAALHDEYIKRVRALREE